MASADCAASAAGQPCGDPLRIILVGLTGTGKSSLANTILGTAAFRAEASPRSVTTRCQSLSGSVDGQSVTLIDTPGFFHTTLSPQEVMEEVGRGFALSCPGPHALLVTMQLGRFTSEQMDTLEWIEAVFGNQASRFTIVVFTMGDQLRGKCITKFLEESSELEEFVNRCHGGCCVFENSDVCSSQHRTESPQQVAQLLEKVKNLVAKNGGSWYTESMYREAERVIRGVREKILEQNKNKIVSLGRKTEEENKALVLKRKTSEEQKRENETEKRRQERLFWCELVTALGRGAAQGAGILGKEGEGKAAKKVNIVGKATALVASPLSIRSATSVVGGAIREGGKVLQKYHKTLLPQS